MKEKAFAGKDQKPHPFLWRGREMKEVFWEVMRNGDVSWDMLLSATQTRGWNDSTVIKAVREGVTFGALCKTGGRGTGKEAMVGITPLGHLWFADLFTEVEEQESEVEENSTERTVLESHQWPVATFVDQLMGKVSKESEDWVAPHDVRCEACGATAWTAFDGECG